MWKILLTTLAVMALISPAVAQDSRDNRSTTGGGVRQKSGNGTFGTGWSKPYTRNNNLDVPYRDPSSIRTNPRRCGSANQRGGFRDLDCQ